MMLINKHNYEAYFLDYHEGNLSEDEIRMLMAFLDDNPDLRHEFDEFENLTLTADDGVFFPGKSALIKNERNDTEDNKLIAYLEGDLDHSEAEKIKKSIQENEMVSEQFDHLAQTVSKPDLSITFPDKEQLKRKPGIIITPYRMIAAAAAVIVLLGIPAILFFNSPADNAREALILSRADEIEAKSIPYQSAAAHPESRPMLQPRYMQGIIEKTEIARIEAIPSQSVKSQYNSIYTNIVFFRDQPQATYSFAFLENSNGADDKTLAGKIFAGLFNKMSAPFKNDNPRERNRSRDFSIWDIAEFGIKGVNALGDHDYTLIRQYNENGNVKGVRILEE